MRPLKQAIYSSRTADKFVVRLPDGMREKIAEVARTHHRSMNSEIIARLEESLIQEDKENNPAMIVDDEGGQPMPVVDAWVPVAGMLVCERLDKTKVYGIKDFDMDSKGNLYAEVAGLDGNDIKKLISHLQPFVVT